MSGGRVQSITDAPSLPAELICETSVSSPAAGGAPLKKVAFRDVVSDTLLHVSQLSSTEFICIHRKT